MVAKRRNVPDPLRRALRLAISVAISGATGFALLEPLGGWHSRWGSQSMMGTKWAAITCVVCNAPVIAKTTEVALERVLGTVAGGLLGYGLALFNDLLPFLDQPFFTVGALMIVAFSSILLGQKLRLDYSGRLFIMTFILVVMAAPRTADAMAVAVTRISGIVFGVILTMIMSVIVFPKSASHQATDSLQSGLAALARLNAVAWGDEHQRCLRGAISTREGSAPRRVLSVGDGITDRLQRDAEPIATPRDQLLMDSEGGDTCCDDVLAEVYAKLSACQDFTVMSKSETYVFTSRGRWCFFPAFKCFPWRTALPNAEMFAVAAASRKVARLLWCLHTSLPQGAEDEVALARYHGATRFLAGLGASCQVYLENLAECFPNQGALDTDQLYTFIEGVETLITASHKASRDSQILLHASWLAETSVHPTPHLENGTGHGGSIPIHVPLRADGPLRADNADSDVAITIKPVSLESAPSMPVSNIRKHHRRSASGNMAFICASDGSVTKVSGGNFRAVENGYQQSDAARFSPVSELLPEGSQTEAVLSEAAAANAEAEATDKSFEDLADSKQGYISQVRWQATQFLLRRLVSELTVLNIAFIRLSAMLPPTRWESRLQRQKRVQGEGSLVEPLLLADQA